MVVRTSDITLRHRPNFGDEVYRVVRFQKLIACLLHPLIIFKANH